MISSVVMNFKDSFIEEVKGFLQKKGFMFQEKVPFFTLRESGIVKVIGLDISSYGSRFTIQPNVLVRSVDVARVAQLFDGERFKGEYYFTIRTTQYDVAQLYSRPEYKLPTHVLKDNSSLQTAIKNFQSFMNDIGFLFFDRFKTLNDFDKWFNDDVLNGTYNFKLGNSGGNAKEGMIVAKLNKNPRYEELFERWITGLEKEGKFNTYIEPLRSLKSFLDNQLVMN